MKRVLSILLCLFIIFSFSGCSSRSSYAKQALMAVYNCLLEGDKQKLKSLLCEGLQNQNDVDDQIDSFFEGIGGGIKGGNKDEIGIMTLEKSRELGETDRYTTAYYFADMRHIIDNNDIEYGSLSIGFCEYDKPQPEMIGIYCVRINDTSFKSQYAILHKSLMESENSEQESIVPAIAPEQEKEISALEEKNHCMMPYRRAVASGDISPNSPKLTLDDTKRIIKEAENVESLNVRIYESGRYENYNQQAEYICQEISKIQPYADTIRSFGGRGSRELEYWITNDEATGERTQIHLTSGGMMVWYEEIDKDGKTKNSEVLFEASLEKNWQDSEENYPVITRPIVPDSASAD